MTAPFLPASITKVLAWMLAREMDPIPSRGPQVEVGLVEWHEGTVRDV